MKEKILKHLFDYFGIEGEDAEELYLSYVQTVADNLKKIRQAMPSQDFMQITQAAHSIKGCALNSGHKEMSDAAKECESAGKSGNLAICQSSAQTIDRLAQML